MNADGQVTIADVNLIISVILGNTTDAEVVKRADVNDDGEVSISDANSVIKVILAWKNQGFSANSCIIWIFELYLRVGIEIGQI